MVIFVSQPGMQSASATASMATATAVPNVMCRPDQAIAAGCRNVPLSRAEVVEVSARTDLYNSSVLSYGPYELSSEQVQQALMPRSVSRSGCRASAEQYRGLGMGPGCWSFGAVAAGSPRRVELIVRFHGVDEKAAKMRSYAILFICMVCTLGLSSIKP